VSEDRSPRSEIQNLKSKIQNPTPLPLVEILPCGFDRRREAFYGAVLSPFGPAEPFSGPAAMIRNALIYAMAEVAVVVHSRFGEGGTWRGATEAMRRGLCPFVVFPGVDEGSARAARAMAGLGAVWADPSLGVEEALAAALAELRAREERCGPVRSRAAWGIQSPLWPAP